MQILNLVLFTFALGATAAPAAIKRASVLPPLVDAGTEKRASVLPPLVDAGIEKRASVLPPLVDAGIE
ncbi:hypothetical protein B0I35DRAFT_477216 [Stachybotrys elegans]|uniref:Uncharacterized protein n=1 Tax=Stachybotrys elegans TaxID=80388 RepID=A0A8K0WRQ1_9HYPO|nr:hypothetical protein B0I35DRAFT_477216 [Stachybotrys elegans]